MEQKYNIPPLRVRGLDCRSGSEFKCHNHEVEKGLFPSCLTSGWRAIIVWFEVYSSENIMKLHFYNVHENKLSKYCLHTAITALNITVLLCL